MDLFCNVCGKEFSAEGFLGENNNRFCSLECKRKYFFMKHQIIHEKEELQWIECIECKKGAYIPKKEVGVWNFCGPLCRGKYFEDDRMSYTDQDEFNAIQNRIKDPEFTVEEYKKVIEPGVCFYCGCKLYNGDMNFKGNLTIDHVVPVSKGGKNHNNLVLACRSCNSGKHDKSQKEYLEYLKNHPEIIEERQKSANENYKLFIEKYKNRHLLNEEQDFKRENGNYEGGLF